MPLTRRDVHKGFIALAASVVGARLASAAPEAPDAPLSDDAFLNRLSFGANPEARAELARLGRAGWLEAQLKMGPNGPEMAGRLARAELWIEFEAGRTEPEEAGGQRREWAARAEYRPLAWLNATPEELAVLMDYQAPYSWAERERPLREVQAAALMRAVHEPAQLNEVMCQFWHDHFSVNGAKDTLTAALFPAYDRAFRTHALGNFRDLLQASATSPVMLHYLNNDDSRASPANENYARELLELHTLGQEHYFNDLYENWRDVPGASDGLAAGYIDDDVYEVARALTGWSIGDGRWLEQGRAPLNGRLHYVEAWHDPYQKRILAVEFGANSAPLADGERLLDLLASHPGTARFVTGKMARRLGLEAPSPAFRDAMAAVFMANRDRPDQIARVIRAMVAHPEFNATAPTKLRRPFEYLAALYRASGAEISPRRDDIFWQLGLAGWHQHEVRPPTGHSDLTIDWADTRTIKGMIDLVLEAHGQWMNLSDDVLRRPPEGVASIGALARHWAARFGVDAAVMAPAYQVLELEPQEDLPGPDDADWLEWINLMMVLSAALDPAFLYR